MGETMEDLNDAYASGLVFFPKTSEEEWERRNVITAERDKKTLILYKQKYEGMVHHYQKNDRYWHTCKVIEIKSYHEVLVERISDGCQELIPMYYFYGFKMLGD